MAVQVPKVHLLQWIIPLVSNFSSLTAGEAFTCGLTSAGKAYCWGRGSENQLGHGLGDLNTRTTPTPVDISVVSSFEILSAGSRFVCGLTDAGLAYCWGEGGDGQLGNGGTSDEAIPQAVNGGFTFSAINAGRDHVFAILQ